MTDGLTAKSYLARQAAAHPAMRPQDLIKLCHQAAFGTDHLLSDPAEAKKRFDEEFASVAEQPTQIYEPISPDCCRVHLSAWKQRELPPEWLFRIFAGSAVPVGSAETFRQLLNEAGTLCGSGLLSFSRQEWEDAQTAYRLSGVGTVHHSAQYSNAEHPAYRLVNAHFIRLIPLLEDLAKLQDSGSAHVVALDGRAASGKTTLAEHLSLILHAGIVHMDDFFLPEPLRTAKRLAEPGGNVHYERFAQEILPKIARKQPFAYRRFDCSVMDFNGSREVCASKWRIVEGAYSSHPLFGSYTDRKAFCTVNPEEQMRRIVLRNGKERANSFAERWIPMEERYFKKFGIMEQADLIL